MIVIGEHDERTLEQLAAVESDAVFAAIMADGHLGYSLPIGGVVGFDNEVSVTGVGFDIACGNCAVQLDGPPPGRQELRELGEQIYEEFTFGVGGINQIEEVDHPVLLSDAWNIIPKADRQRLHDKARKQLGTIGSGNHYIDTFVDNFGQMWVGVHFGSRGLGHTIATNFIKIANGMLWGQKGKAEENICLLDLDTQAGQDYWALMEMAGQYAYAGRDWACNKVAEMTGMGIVDRVHNHHNFAWKEPGVSNHHPDLVVVRKGATPAYAGQRGFIGGSMGDDAVIVRGSTQEDLAHLDMAEYVNLTETMQLTAFSTVHGAGRTMSRTKARGKHHRKTGRKMSEGVVDYGEVMEWIKSRRVLVWGADLDESPLAYRRLKDVLAHQGDSIQVEYTLTPLTVAMNKGYLGDTPFLTPEGD